MLKSPAFYVMYVMFILTATGGLILTAQIKPIAKVFSIADSHATLIGFTVLALPFTLSISRILNGVSRPLFGWLSDRFGREQTMFAAFAIEAAAFFLFPKVGHDPAGFVLITGLVFLAYGEIYSLFPAICADCYGKQFASANSGLLYTGKGAASLLVPLSGIIAVSAAGWNHLFVVLGMLNVIAAVLALIALKPMCARVPTLPVA